MREALPARSTSMGIPEPLCVGRVEDISSHALFIINSHLGETVA